MGTKQRKQLLKYVRAAQDALWHIRNDGYDFSQILTLPLSDKQVRKGCLQGLSAVNALELAMIAEGDDR